jgi:hypothetical protein
MLRWENRVPEWNPITSQQNNYMNNKKETVLPTPAAAGDSQKVQNASGHEKTIENHQQAAAHHMEAAKHNLDAAKAYAEGNLEKAAHSAMLAWGHHNIAGEFISDDAKHHAQQLKRTNYK